MEDRRSGRDWFMMLLIEPYTADILVEGGKIRQIAPILDEETIHQAKLLDAKGL